MTISASGCRRFPVPTERQISRLSVIHRVIDIGLYAPERLEILNSRLDGLTNNDLHHMAVSAVQGLPVIPNVFDGLIT